MLSIGEFSKLCQVTTKTLRYYDNVNLLKPVHYNPETGYRYYDVSQLKEMLAVLRLKKYGFSLDEIGSLLHARASDLIQSMEAKLAEQIACHETQKRLLAQMKKDIDDLEKGFDMMQYKNIDIELVQTSETTILSVRETISINDFSLLFTKLRKLMEEAGSVCMGAPFAIYHSKEFDPESTDVEVGFPVNAKTRFTRQLSGGLCAKAVHRGEYSGLAQPYSMLAEWIDHEGYFISAPPYEKYLNDPEEVPPEQLITEIYFPISK